MTTRAKDPWHKRYHGNALGGYVGLSLELRGAYTTILDLLYDSGWEEGLPDRERWFAGHMDISVGKWRKIRQALLDAGKIDVLENGYLSNSRYRIERERSQILSEKRAESGQKGGEKRAKNAVKVTGNSHDSDEKSPDLLDNVQASASNLPPSRGRAESREAESESEKEEEESPAGRPIPSPRETPVARLDDLDLKTLFDACCNAAGCNLVSPAIVSRSMDLVAEWRTLGISFDETVLPVIERTIAQSDDHTSSLNRFNKGVLAAHARKAATKKQPAKGPPPAPMRTADIADPRVDAVRAKLRATVGERTYANWFGPDNAAMKINGVGLIITARSSFIAAQIEEKHRDHIVFACQVADIPDFRITHEGR